MKRLENKISLITGAGSGMGKEIALLFAKEGSKVVATDINQARLDDLEKEIRKNGGEVTTLNADMRMEEDIAHMVEVATTTYGTLDILVNNAGVMDNIAPVGDLDNATWEKLMKVNAEGPFKAMRCALKVFLPKGKGVIVNIASLGGLKGACAGAAYTASKHALVGLTKNTAGLYAKMGIRCNAIAPGNIETNIQETIDPEKVAMATAGVIQAGAELCPRIGQPAEIAYVALFLASDESSLVNGAILPVDAGWSAL